MNMKKLALAAGMLAIAVEVGAIESHGVSVTTLEHCTGYPELDQGKLTKEYFTNALGKKDVKCVDGQPNPEERWVGNIVGYTLPWGDDIYTSGKKVVVTGAVCYRIDPTQCPCVDRAIKNIQQYRKCE